MPSQHDRMNEDEPLQQTPQWLLNSTVRQEPSQTASNATSAKLPMKSKGPDTAHPASVASMQILQNGELLTTIPLSPSERAEWTLANVKKWLVTETGKSRSEHLPPGFAGNATVPESVIVFLDSESSGEPLPDSTRVEDIGCTAVLLLKGLAAVQPGVATKLDSVERAYRKILSGTSLDETEQELMDFPETTKLSRQGYIQAGKFMCERDHWRERDHWPEGGHWSEEIVVEGVGSTCTFRGITARGRKDIEETLGIKFLEDGITTVKDEDDGSSKKLSDIRVSLQVFDGRGGPIETGKRIGDLTKWTQFVETGGSVSVPGLGQGGAVQASTPTPNLAKKMHEHAEYRNLSEMVVFAVEIRLSVLREGGSGSCSGVVHLPPTGR